MNEQHIPRLEARLEQMVEGAFAVIFGRKLRPHDVAIQLVRAMEDNLKAARGSDARKIAPDEYIIELPQAVHGIADDEYPQLEQKLADYLIELATFLDCRLLQRPAVRLIVAADGGQNRLIVRAKHVVSPERSTAALEKVTLPPGPPEPVAHASLLINSGRSVPLDQDVINIGRNWDNQIVIDDPSVSRLHVQLRRRDHQYLLFDADSRSGTLVNNVRVREHGLRSGDIIQIGETRMLYVEDDDDTGDDDLSATQAYDPVE